MNFQRTSRRIAAGTAFLTALGALSAATGPAAGGAAAAPTVAGSVIATLVKAAGSVAIADDSTATGCMAADPQPVAYRTDRVVLATALGEAAAADRVRAALAAVGTPAEITGAETISLRELPGAQDVTPIVSVSFQAPAGAPVPIVHLARHLRHESGIPSSPDYLLAPSSGPSEFWPDGPPVPTTTPAPARDAAIGAGTTIFVYDGGLPSASESNNPPNVTRLTQADHEPLDSRAPFGVVDIDSAGHTTAIAGVIATVAPGALVEAARITDATGVATDVSAARRMANTLRHANSMSAMPDLIVNAFGSAACDAGPPGGEMVPLGLQMVADAVDRNDEALTVASSGNRSTPRRFYPAAFASVVAVGALDTTADSDGSAWTSPSRSGPKADFSNWGPWVDAWASGVELATTHVKGYRFEPTGPVIDGLALVKGTSFAAPLTAALIAEQIAATGVRAEVAWAAIRASGTRCSTGIGSGVAVTLTSLTSTATTPAAASAPSRC